MLSATEATFTWISLHYPCSGVTLASVRQFATLEAKGHGRMGDAKPMRKSYGNDGLAVGPMALRQSSFEIVIIDGMDENLQVSAV